MSFFHECAEGLERAVGEFKAALPGWWFTVGECQVSADASCGPTRESCHISLIAMDRRFDDGFHADLPQPAKMADALRDVMGQAFEAIEAAQAMSASGQDPQGLEAKPASAVPTGCAQTEPS